MSAFMVSKHHIDLMVATAVEGPRDHHGWHEFSYYTGSESQRTGSKRHPVDYTTASAIGQMLARENARSLTARYGDKLEDQPEYVQEYHWHRPSVRLTAVQALKAIRCYDYQACESADWESTEAAAFCEALTVQLINALPGYDAAPWEWVEEREAVS